MINGVLLTASALMLFATLDTRTWRDPDLDRFVVLWIVAVAAWPSLVTYLIAPLVWTSADQSGSLFPAIQYSPALLMSCLAFWRALRDRRAELSVPALLIGSLLLFSAAGFLTGAGPKAVNLTVAAGMFLGVVLRPRRVTVRSVGVGSVAAICVLTIAIAIATTVNAGATLESCRIDKCNILGESLTSPFAGNGNSLGLAVVLLTPFALAVCSPIRVVATVAGVAAIQEVATSRTAIIGFAAAVATVLLVRLIDSGRAKTLIGCLSLATALAVSLFPLYGKFSGSAYSFRGYLWEAAERLITDAPIFGHGATYWTVMGESALFDANYSPHNGWFDIVVALGMWGAGIVVIGVYVHVRSTSAESRPFVCAYYACVLGVSAFESVYVPFYLGITPFAAILPLILYDPAPSAASGLAPAAWYPDDQDVDKEADRTDSTKRSGDMRTQRHTERL